MKKKFILLVVTAIFSLSAILSYAQEAPERKLVLRHAQERGDTTVAVEAYLIGEILEATIYVRMYATKPKIFNVTMVGPKLGRLSPRSRETIYPKASEEEVSFPTTDLEGGLIRFSKRTQNKIAKGTLTRELAKFRIPAKKILLKRRYELRISVESLQRPGMPETFSFVLKDFAQLIQK